MIEIKYYHPELVSGFHRTGNLHEGYLAYGMLKQVQHDRAGNIKSLPHLQNYNTRHQ